MIRPGLRGGEGARGDWPLSNLTKWAGGPGWGVGGRPRPRKGRGGARKAPPTELLCKDQGAESLERRAAAANFPRPAKENLSPD